MRHLNIDAGSSTKLVTGAASQVQFEDATWLALYNYYIIFQSIRRFETSKSKLEGQERALTAQYNREVKQNQELRQKG